MIRPGLPLLRCATAVLVLSGLSACAGLASWDTQPQRETYNTASTPRPAEPLPDRPVGPGDHMVRKGDTVYSIAFRNQLDYRELARWNGIGSDYLIRPGQVLHLGPPPPLKAKGDEIASQPIDMNEVQQPQALSTTRTPVIAAIPAPGSTPVPIPLPDSTLPPAPSPGPPTVTTPVVPTPSGAGGAPGWRWPVDGTVIRGYAPAQGSKGLDFTGTVGQPVVAAAAGKVVYSGSALKGYGELVIIKHDDLRLSAYGYNRRRLVQEGDVVAAGQQIAELGLGPESKPLLHFEVRERGKPINPVPFLPAR